MLHIPTHIIPLKEDFTLDPADYHGLHETIVIANPNAPTRLCLPRDAIEGILQSNPDSVVIGGLAYITGITFGRKTGLQFNDFIQPAYLNLFGYIIRQMLGSICSGTFGIFKHKGLSLIHI